MTDPNWTVIVEQPTAEAFAATRRLERQLTIAIGLALLGTLVLGYLWGRSFIQRIFALTRVTRSIAEGKLDTRVALTGHDEIRELGDAFNSMADRLVELQEDIRKQERQVMFGRIAAGLVHDLSHPIQNIGNSCKLIMKMWDDAEYRETFRRMVDREMVIVKRVLDDLRNIAQADSARAVPGRAESLGLRTPSRRCSSTPRPPASRCGRSCRTSPLFIEGDVFALGRVYRNLILNAIQATAPGGLVVAAAEATTDRVQVRVVRHGLRHSARIACRRSSRTSSPPSVAASASASRSRRKIVEQLGGTISVASEVGKGTTFVLEFPRTEARPIALVAG